MAVMAFSNLVLVSRVQQRHNLCVCLCALLIGREPRKSGADFCHVDPEVRRTVDTMWPSFSPGRRRRSWVGSCQDFTGSPVDFFFPSIYPVVLRRESHFLCENCNFRPCSFIWETHLERFRLSSLSAYMGISPGMEDFIQPESKRGFNLYMTNKYWLVVWNIFFHILGIIIPTDFHIFKRGWNHQPECDLAIQEAKSKSCLPHKYADFSTEITDRSR